LTNGGAVLLVSRLGEVLRAWLHQGTTPVFRPPREPWRDGTIEHFNDTFRSASFAASD
jgi:hypothetical protein